MQQILYGPQSLNYLPCGPFTEKRLQKFGGEINDNREASRKGWMVFELNLAGGECGEGVRTLRAKEEGVSGFGTKVKKLGYVSFVGVRRLCKE